MKSHKIENNIYTLFQNTNRQKNSNFLFYFIVKENLRYVNSINEENLNEIYNLNYTIKVHSVDHLNKEIFKTKQKKTLLNKEKKKIL